MRHVSLSTPLGPDDSIEINGSSTNSIDYVRNHIERFSSSLAINGGMKICFIDEADYVTKPRKVRYEKLLKIIRIMSATFWQ